MMLTAVLDTLFPPRCPLCREPVAGQGTLCAECWKELSFIHDPQCVTCGHPFEYAIAPEALCGPCLAETPPYAQARAVLKYDEHGSKPVVGFKFHDRTSLAPMFGAWLKRAGGIFLERADAVVPVPLSRLRLLQRRYNQAALLAYALGKEARLPVMPDALLRRKHTRPQSELTRAQRLTNVQGAFTANPKRANGIKEKKIVLVDDVITTGATLSACTKALLKAGATEVYVLTLARTVAGG